MSDYRMCRNGSILLSLLNEHDSPVNFTLNAPDLLTGKTVERLNTGGIVETNSDGFLSLSMIGDGYLLLYVYDENGGPDSSLVDASPYRIWFESAPQVVWPGPSDYAVEVGFDTRGEALTVGVTLESIHDPRATYGSSTEAAASGTGTAALDVPVPDADLTRAAYRSAHDGGSYQLRARLEKNGVTVSEVTIPVRLLWGVRPTNLPDDPIAAGSSYNVNVEWQELPGYEPGEAPTSIDRADLWESDAATGQHYNIVLQVRDATEAVVASDTFVTREATGNADFSIDVPGGATPPFHWYAFAQTAPNASTDLVSSFEGLMSGAAVPFNPMTEDIGPTVAGEATYTGELGPPTNGPDNPGLPVDSSRETVVVAVVDGVQRLLTDNANGGGVLVGQGGDAGTIDYDTGIVIVEVRPS